MLEVDLACVVVSCVVILVGYGLCLIIIISFECGFCSCSDVPMSHLVPWWDRLWGTCKAQHGRPQQRECSGTKEMAVARATVFPELPSV